METSSAASLAVPLPRPRDRSEHLPAYTTPDNHHPWAISPTLAALDAPFNDDSRCDRHGYDRGDACAEDIDDDEERHTVDPDVIRDIVIGLSDGLTVPFALTAGLASLGEAKVVVLGGIAELIAGAISMGVGGFLASQSERDYGRYLRRRLNERLERACSGRMEAEVHKVLGPVGVDEKLSRQVARNLLDVESEAGTSRRTSRAGSRPGSSHSVDERSSLLGARPRSDIEDGINWNDVGITAFLLKFGEGLEEVPTSRLYISAFTIGMGYFIGGLIPLLPYLFFASARVALGWSALVTGITLLLFGVFRTHVSGAKGGWGGYAKGALSMLVVGGAAAGSAYGIVALLEGAAHS